MDTTMNAAVGDNLWFFILDSVQSGSRSVSTKNLIVLGTSQSGKSTLLERLSSPTGEARVHMPVYAADASQKPVLDLGLSYSFLDMGDGEETTARLGIYQLPSAAAPYPSLLPLALSPTTLLDSLVVIVLDWSRPWSFVRELLGWIGILEQVLSTAGAGWEGAEGQERLEAHLRHYFEPSNAPASAAPTSSAAQLVDLESPLPEGVLSTNLGLGIVIVCTKSDQINELERDKDFVEEQFDHIQQTLRTIALRYGAALFFTSHSRPTSFVKLRAYILHRLFARPSVPIALLPASLTPAISSTAVPVALSSSSFPFTERANVVDRDQVLVPSGWDSWGKIRVLREKYEVETVGRGWEADVAREKGRLAGQSTEQIDALEREVEAVEGRRGSMVRMYEQVVIDLDSFEVPSRSTAHVAAQDEQTYLKQQFDTLEAERRKDPRNAFTARLAASSMTDGAAGSLGLLRGMILSESAVGPMARDGTTDGDDLQRRLNAKRGDPTTGRPPLIGSLTTSSDVPPSATLPSSTTTSQPPSTPVGASNVVLANFFSSLLEARSTPVGGVSKHGLQGIGRSMSGTETNADSGAN